MKKYKILKKDSIEVGSRTLYRVKALRDFGDVKKGDVGGYIEKESNLSHEGDCWVFGNASVFNHARVSGDARVFGNASVFGNARVSDNTKVSGNATVFENATVSGNAKVFGNARIFKNAWVCESAMVCRNAKVCGNAFVYGKVLIYDHAEVSGNADVFGTAKVSDNTTVSGNAICSKTPLNLIGLKYNITITDNYVKVGCMQWLKKAVDSVKYKDVKDENITLGEFRKIKKVVKFHLNN